MSEPLVPVNYAARDWAAFREVMLEAAGTAIPEWTSRSPSDFAMVLIELFAYVGDNLSFYTDRIANEAFLQTAVQRSSVLNIARMLDYHPGMGAAAQTELQFTTVEDSGVINIPAGTQVTTQGDVAPVIFETDEDLSIDSDATTVGTVLATEGRSVNNELLGISPGGPNQFYVFSQNPVIDGSVRLTVDVGDGPRLWQEIENLIEAKGIDPVFVTAEGSPSGRIAVFGDDVNGRTPLVGAEIAASYRIGGGARGNLPTNALAAVNNPIPGVISVRNLVPSVGGADPESLAEIRVNAPRSLTTLQRAVTVQDHANLALQRTFVARAGASTDLTGADQRRVTVYIAPEGGGMPTADQKTEVQKFLQDRTVIDYLIEIEDPTYVGIDVEVTVHLNPSYNEDHVLLTLEKSIRSLLEFNEVGFAHRVTLASIYRAVSSTVGIEYGSIDVLDVSGSTGLSDVQVDDGEIPEVGTVTINVES